MMKEVMLIGILISCCIVFLQWSRKAVTTTEYRYENQRIPHAFEGFRIVQVSDLQSEYFGREQKRLLAAIRKAAPDIIVFTGDLVDRNHTDYRASMVCIQGLCGIAPVYYVNGNHEMALPSDEILDVYRQMENLGVRLLFDRCEKISLPHRCRRNIASQTEGAAIFLAGLSEETLWKSKILGGALPEGKVSSRKNISDTEIDGSVIIETAAAVTEQCGETDFLILLVHEPQFADTYAKTGASLVFAGHAHGGQIRLPMTEGLFAPGQGFLPKMTAGMHKSGETTVVISRGLGNSTFPLRLFNRPEIITVELHRSR